MLRQTQSKDAFGTHNPTSGSIGPGDLAKQRRFGGFGRRTERKSEAKETPRPSNGGAKRYSELYESDRRSLRRKTIVVFIIVLLLTAFSLTCGYEGQGSVLMKHYSPIEVIQAIGTIAYVNIGQLIGSVSDSEANRLIQESRMFYDESHRLMQTLLVLVAASLISVAGMLFQVVFKNPIASPTILGVQSGVNIGVLIMVIVFGAAAVNMTEMRFVFSYIGGLITLALVFLFGIVTSSEKGSFEIKNMLLSGVMLSQLFGVIVSVLSSSVFSPEIHETMLRINLVTERSDSPFALAVVVGTGIVTMLPLMKYRFKLNLLSVSDEEMRVGGLNPMKTRALALCAGSLMILAAQSAIGGIAMASLVIPFLSRAIYGVEFRKQLLGCVLIGTAVIMVCYVISLLIPFGKSGVSMTIIASVVLVPLYAWIMATNERALEL